MKNYSIRLAVGAFSAMLLSGCNTVSSEQALRSQPTSISNEDKISSILDAAPEFDPFGFQALTLSDVEENLVELAKKTLDIGNRLTVTSVGLDSLASEAGLKEGDVIVSINKEYISKGQTATTRLKNQIVPRIDWSIPIEILVIRDGFAMRMEFPVRLDIAS